MNNNQCQLRVNGWAGQHEYSVSSRLEQFGDDCCQWSATTTDQDRDPRQCSAGGGAFHVVATESLLLEGVINVDGMNGPKSGGGGGSGGAVWIDTPVLQGTGDIFAVGGSGETTNAGGGGGGRISVHCINSTFTGAYAAYGGWANAGHPGSAGSIYNNCGKFKGYLMSSLPTELGGVLVLNGVKLDIKVDTDASTDQVVATTRTIDVAESGYLNLRGVDPTLPIHDGRPFDKLVSSPSNVIYLSEGTTNSLSAATIVGSNPDSSTDTSEYTFDIKRLYVDRGSTVVLPKIVQLINFTLTVEGSVLGLSNFTVKRSTVDFSNMFNIDAAHPDIAPQDLNLNTFTVVGSLFTLPAGGRIYVTHDFTIESFPLSLFDPTQKMDSVVS
jgi:hypothetical protein